MLKYVSVLALLVFSIMLPMDRCSVVSAASPELQSNSHIVIDSYHSHNYINLPPDADMYDYHNGNGYRHLFNYLAWRGANVQEIKEGPLNEAILTNVSMLFINLSSMDLPPFRVSEIKAIKQYVENGGALLVVTDHTNCYYHAYKLLPLFDELGIRINTETACDNHPMTLANGNGWIRIERFKTHPITRGLETIAMETGGTVDDRYGVAFTSDKAWGDQWISHPYGEDDTPGFYGNWTLDKGERTGSLAVMLAKNLGQGRIVVIGDQNMWGDGFCNYADNYKFFLNSVAWLTSEKQMADPKPYEQWKTSRILAYESYSLAAWGNDDNEGFYNLFVSLGRQFWTFASNNLSSNADLVLFAHDGYLLPEDAKTALVNHLKSGRSALIIGSQPVSTSRHMGLVDQLTEKLGKPQLRVEGNQVTYQWEGYGPVIMLNRKDVFLNSALPNPQQHPNAEQQAELSSLEKVIAENIQR